jgi:RNA polymerase sigma-70 factor (ECF subfamily)
MTFDDEAQWIARAKRDPDAFRALYHAYFQRVFAYVAYRVNGAADAEDVTSDIFMQVVKGIGGFHYRGDGAFAAWLFRIAHNCVATYHRRAFVRRTLALDDVPEIASPYATPEGALADKDCFIRLHTAIRRLSPRRQEIITLRYFGDLRNQEIAAVLGLDERTVAAHLSRALRDLQAELADEIERQAE